MWFEIFQYFPKRLSFHSVDMVNPVALYFCSIFSLVTGLIKSVCCILDAFTAYTNTILLVRTVTSN
jgi:hypothetical protein